MAAEFAGSNSMNRTQTGSGHFMLTLCRLAAPVSLRPPQSPHLKSFTFFTSSARQPDGSERLYLHMGYFETLSDAERWAQIARLRYPNAIVTIAPSELSRPAKPQVMSLQADTAGLSDTQVLKILERRHAGPGQHDVDAGAPEPIALLRPEDTSTREALREAVAQGAAVSFAVQLHWATQPLDLSRVPALPIFRAYRLYATESHREGRSRYFLRLGFFTDPISAREVASQVRANFATAAVVPVAEEEVTRAREARSDGAAIPYLAQQRIEPKPEPPPVWQPAPKSATNARRKGPTTLQETLEQLAARELWTDPDSLSESGVRHLKVEVQEQEQPSRSRRP
jgi:hypothetical protein